MPSLLSPLVFAGLALAPALAHAHARLMVPAPRFDTAGTGGGIKTGPCGAPKPATAAHTFVMGTTMTIKIDETIVHPGHYELFWSGTTDAALTVIAGMNNIVNADGQQITSVTLTWPNTVTENGTLQLIQVMTENPAAPTNYYSCADIKLVAPGADLAGVVAADLAVPENADLTGFDNNDDLAMATDDASVGTDVDLGKKPPAESAGLPGCSFADPGAGTALPLALLLCALFAASLAPTLRRAYARRRR